MARGMDGQDRSSLSRRRLLAAAGGFALAGTAMGAARAAAPSIDAPAGGQLARAARGKAFQLEPLPPLPVRPRTWDPGDFVLRVAVDARRLAFTFDDGPSPYNTYPVLTALRNAGIKATFFLVGVNVRSFPQIARHIAEEGHELGNHSIYHTPYNAGALAGQIPGNQGIIRSATGVTPVVHRAPGLTRGSAILYTCATNGLYEAHTHMNTTDWMAPRRSASYLISEFSRVVSSGGILLYHDGGNPRPTPAAVPSMIQIAKSRGYTLHTCTELVNLGQPIPGRASYSGLDTGDAVDDGADPDGHAHDEGYVDCCQFDAASELRAYLESGDVRNYAERMRIVEALADLEAHRAEHE